MSVYVDPSFLVSLYVTDTHSAEAGLRLSSNPMIWLTPLHVAEWTHAVEQHVFRRQMSAADAAAIHDWFRATRMSGLWEQVSVPEGAYERCSDLGRRYASQFGLRTLDTLHVACALELGAKGFWIR